MTRRTGSPVSGCRVERGVLHALDHLEAARRHVAGLPGDGFVNVGGHGTPTVGMQILAFGKWRTLLHRGGSMKTLRHARTLLRAALLPAAAESLQRDHLLQGEADPRRLAADALHHGDGALRRVLVAFAVAPGIIWTVQSLRKTSRSTGGGVGEVLFLTGLGVFIFWLYYRNYIFGTEAILPASWHNQLLKHLELIRK